MPKTLLFHIKVINNALLNTVESFIFSTQCPTQMYYYYYCKNSLSRGETESVALVSHFKIDFFADFHFKFDPCAKCKKGIKGSLHPFL